MTINHATGEIVEFDRAAAERRAERITLRLDAIADNHDAVVHMIREAIEKRDDAALGYRSVGEYVSDRFGGSLTRLGLDVRRALVGELTEAGMSTRAIAPVLGISKSQVANDQQVSSSGHLNETPEAAAPRPLAASGQTSESGSGADDDLPVEPVSAAPALRPSVTGLDGKTYARPEPKPTVKFDEHEWNAQDRAEELARNLSRNLSLLFAVTDAERRAEYIANWRNGTRSLRPFGADFITPKHMRELSAALLTFADEWERSDV